ncbi:MAG: hypothetical protein K1V76_00910 [Candidatus Amulumruptor sp.]
MKLKLFLITVFSISLFFEPAFAESNTTTHTASIHRKVSNKRPRVRGLNGKPAPTFSIQCSYSREHICFDLPGEVDFMEVTITDAYGITWSGFVTQDDPCCDIPSMTGPAQIECTIDMSDTFTGTLIF